MSNQNDPYLYSAVPVLINKFNLKDAAALQEVEGIIFELKNADPLPAGNLDYAHLKAIHKHFFGDIYEWAGEERTIDFTKGDSYFGHCGYIASALNKLFAKLKNENYLTNLKPDEFCTRLSFYFNEINAAHPFREGNGRTQRAFCDLIAEKAGYHFDWVQMDEQQYIQASIAGFNGDCEMMASLFRQIISPIDRSHRITAEETNLHLQMMAKINLYVEKQLELTELITHKNQYILSDPALSKNFGQQAMQLNNELESIAQDILTDSTGEKVLKLFPFASLPQQGGFAAIHERLKNNSEPNPLDIVAVIRHAQSTTHSLSQALSQGRGRRQR